MRQHGWRGCIVVALSVLGASGCGGNKPVRVSGTVTLDGQPLAEATVSFAPDESSGRTAGGKTDADGRFELTTFNDGDGALPGQYHVTVNVADTTVAQEFYKGKAGEPQDMGTVMMMRRSPEDRQKFQAALKKAPRSPVPDLYRTVKTTPLKALVPTDGPVKLELKSSMGRP